MTEERTCGRIAGMLVVAATVMFVAGGAFAEEEPEASEGPPLPLHTIEGVGGLVLTPMALLVNPGPPGTTIGKPAVAVHVGGIGHKDFEAASFTWTLFERLELGYAVNILGLDDFEDDLQVALGGAVENGPTPGPDIRTGHIGLHHFNARLNLIREGEWDQAWMPAVTAGVHYKYNDEIHKINRRLGDALETIGYNDNDGVDFTLTATKAVPVLGKPVLFTAGARASKAAQLGLVGFTDDYQVVFEGSALVLVTDRLAVGTEYRQMPDQMGRIAGVIKGESDWWDVHAAYIVNDHMNIYAVVGDVGTVLNQRDEILYALVLKYEF